MFPEFVVSDEEWRAFLSDKQAAVAGQTLARRFGWKVGDRVPIKGTIYPGVWEFNLRGIYAGARPEDDTTQFWFRSDYLEERTPTEWRGFVGWYTLRIASPDEAVRVARAIDERFANSPWETRTQTEQAFAASFVKQIGNIELLMLAIGGVVFFTLLLVTGNTMAIAVRERTGELAVLKAVGFPDGFVLGLVLAESLVVAAVGGALGLASIQLYTLRGDPTGGLLPLFYLPPSALVAGLVLALAVGFAAGALPALTAMRLSVVAALRRV
jgi:putative ABC transport system permease protein